METEDFEQMTDRMQTDTSSPTTVSSSLRSGTVIPNRIFVGMTDKKTNENDLRTFFAQYGSVEEVKIIRHTTGVSKGYGFITFQTQEDAHKVLQEAENLYYKGRKLRIAPALRKEQIQNPVPGSTVVPEDDTMYLTTSSGHPCIYNNGMAYFHTPQFVSVPQLWPAPPPFLATLWQWPVPQAPPLCLATPWQWPVPQSLFPSSSPSFLYLKPSEVNYQPLYSDQGVQVLHHQLYAQSAIAMPALDQGYMNTLLGSKLQGDLLIASSALGIALGVNICFILGAVNRYGESGESRSHSVGRNSSQQS